MKTSQPSPLWVLLRDFQSLPSPDAFHPLVVHLPALGTEHGGDPPIAIAAVLAGLSVPPGDAVLPASPGNYATNSGVKLTKKPLETMA